MMRAGHNYCICAIFSCFDAERVQFSDWRFYPVDAMNECNDFVWAFRFLKKQLH